jgi:hypothetical protein
MAIKNEIARANLQIWGKGFRVSEDTEEFQRYVPKNRDELSSIERQLESLRWGSLLEQLYGISERDLAGQFCVLFDANEMMSISVATTTDKHRRPSLVLVTASVRISWEHNEPEESLACIAALSLRLAGAYSKSFDGNPAQVQKQLKEDAFLPSRAFDLADEIPDARQDWTKLLSSVRRWKGIKGIATPRLAGLGANMIVGTRHESERAFKQNAIDGYIDVRTCEIHPLTGGIALWQEEPKSKQPDEMLEAQQSRDTDLQELKASVARIEARLETLMELTKGIVTFLEKAPKKRWK